MLAKKYRLPIQNTMRRAGRVRRTALCTIKIFYPEFPYSRFGVLITKKIAASAVKRNALRRMIMDAILKIRGAWPVADYLVIAHSSSATATKEEIYENCLPLSID